MVYADLSSDESDEDEDEGDESGELWPNIIVEMKVYDSLRRLLFFGVAGGMKQASLGDNGVLETW